MPDRREVLALGSAAGAALLLPGKAAADPAGPETVGHYRAHGGHRSSGGKPPAARPFSVRMPIPPVLEPVATGRGVDFYDLTIRPTTVEILPGVRTPALTYGGRFVGPTIRARAGRLVKIRYRNRLGDVTNVHLHGGHVPAGSDGHPTDVIAPGGSQWYHYPNRQPAATLWYHAHAHHLEAEQVFRGLHGFYLIEDPDERRLGLPRGRYDIPVLLRDAKFDEQGGLFFDPFDDPSTRTTLLANGRPQPYLPVAARRYRFRFLNASNHRTFRLDLDGEPMLQVGSDGALLPAPVSRTELVLTPGERADVVIDFRRVGRRLVLSDEIGPVLRFDVYGRVRDRSRVPDVLRPLPPLPPATHHRDVELGLSDDQQVFWIDGKPFDPDRVDARVRRGTTETWRIINLDTVFGGIEHNFHLHLVRFRVLDRDGGPPLPGEEGLKDTVSVPPGTSVRVQATFGDYLGRYVYHCHMMEHSSQFAMMAQLEVVP